MSVLDLTDTGSSGNSGEVEHLDVIVIGAGLSGIAAGYHLQDQAPWAEYTILESRSAIGGTWDLFRYPGIRSDSDMFTLGYSFRPWNRDDAIGEGADIRDYIVETAEEFGIDDKIRFRHRVVGADFSTEDAIWHLTVQRAIGDEVDEKGIPLRVETIEMTCGFLFSCAGYYRYDEGFTPDFDGLDDFDGTLVHPQFWPEDLEYAGKKVVVIGSGATAVTLIPAMADETEHITMLQRSPSFVAGLPRNSPISRTIRKVLPASKSGGAVRWFHALGGQTFFEWCQKNPARSRKLLTKLMTSQLPEGYDVGTHFNPKYDPWDQRLCLAPDGDFFQAIRRGSASVVTDTIDRFTETGILLGSGAELEADIVVSATGLQLQFFGGVDVRVDGEVVPVNERLTYKGMMLEGVPNAAIAVGYTNASWTLKCDLTCEYIGKLLDEMRQRGMRQVTAVNRDESISAEPILGLSSGYIQRSLDLFPLQGQADPWRVHQSYIKDYRAMKRNPVIDVGIELSHPVGAERPLARV